MLRALRIRNMAVIDTVSLEFEPGLNVLTGETGAGKSVITRAIGLLCGERSSTEAVRRGAEEAVVEGVFALSPWDRAGLLELGVEAGEELQVRRVIPRQGKGRAWLDGGPAAASLLAQVGDRLLRVYGQHEQTALLRPEAHLEMLDAVGADRIDRAAMASAWAAWRAATSRLAAIEAHRETDRQRRELLDFQVDELRQAAVQEGEEEELQQERERLRHAEKLVQICRQGEESLYAGEEAVHGALSRIVGVVQEAARLDSGLTGVVDLLRQATVQVEEAASELRRRGERLRPDPERLLEIEERLTLLARLKRKYEVAADGLPERLRQLEAEQAALTMGPGDVAAARVEVERTEEAARRLAGELSQARRAVAAELEQRMEVELQALGMLAGTFRVAFAPSAETSRLTETGVDEMEFHLSANPGEPPLPLARIASGGELSRILLALKSLTAGRGEVPTLIFDEVDTGIGGTVAEAVGRRMRDLAAGRQILCITHLPQIAALADHQYAVEKRVEAGRTVTTAQALAGEERVAELARMLGGNSHESEQYARRLLSGARPPASP